MCPYVISAEDTKEDSSNDTTSPQDKREQTLSERRKGQNISRSIAFDEDDDFNPRRASAGPVGTRGAGQSAAVRAPEMKKEETVQPEIQQVQPPQKTEPSLLDLLGEPVATTQQANGGSAGYSTVEDFFGGPVHETAKPQQQIPQQQGFGGFGQQGFGGGFGGASSGDNGQAYGNQHHYVMPVLQHTNSKPSMGQMAFQKNASVDPSLQGLQKPLTPQAQVQ